MKTCQRPSDGSALVGDLRKLPALPAWRRLVIERHPSVEVRVEPL